MFVVIFEVYPHAAQVQQYLDFGKLLRPELEQIDGFIDNERFTGARTAGRVLSLSTWRDEKALIRWRTHARHHDVQEQGRTVVFNNYKLRVGEITDDTAPPKGYSLRHQRFDETEVGDTKVILLFEISPLPDAAADLAQMVMIDTEHPPAGWVESERFDSIYNPGKVALLTGWRNEASARAWYDDQVGPFVKHLALRCRFVRVIRAYGMFDRIESPQYYPAVTPDAATLCW
jgi:heme-degrading monooxygenase HmoA